MTVPDALAEGQLLVALELQANIVAAQQGDSARLFLFELQALAGRYRDAWNTLNAIASPDPAWPAARKWYRQILRCAHRRDRQHRPKFIGEIPKHAALRQRAIRSIQQGQPLEALAYIDRADRRSPHSTGHVDGREFDGLRDADDRFASVLEAFVEGHYVWLPFEQIRAIVLMPAEGWLERLFRPATIRTHEGLELPAVLPLVYPETGADSFALGYETDHTNPDGGPVRRVGGRLLLIGEEELLLGEIQMLEFAA